MDKNVALILAISGLVIAVGQVINVVLSAIRTTRLAAVAKEAKKTNQLLETGFATRSGWGTDKVTHVK